MQTSRKLEVPNADAPGFSNPIGSSARSTLLRLADRRRRRESPAARHDGQRRDYLPHEPTAQRAEIVVVEDDRQSLEYLCRLLSRRGYEVRPAPSSSWALTTIRKDPPDLVLLDLCMPEIDGYELCRELEKDERTRDIPVIVVSALDTVGDKVEAFQAGAIDYVSKPIAEAEVLARVGAHLRLRSMQQRLERQNERLEEQKADLQAFAHMVAHDLKNSVAVMRGGLDLVAAELDQETASSVSETLGIAYRGCEGMSAIIDGLLLLAKVQSAEEVELGELDMGKILDEVRARVGRMVEKAGGDLIVPARWPSVTGHPAWIAGVWTNYVTNAVKYGGSPPRIELGATSTPAGSVRFFVRDNGPGLSAEEQELLFKPFSRLHADRARGHGLGLSIVKRTLEKLGGSVGVDSKVGQGSTFWFTLPACNPAGHRRVPSDASPSNTASTSSP